VIALGRRFSSLDWSDKRLLIEAASLLWLAWTGLHLLPFQVLRRMLGRYAGASNPMNHRRPDAVAVSRIGWAITAVAARFPESATCLVQALAADAILRRKGFASWVRFGVRARVDGAVRFEAHAWVECNGVVVVGDVEGLQNFVVLAAPGSP
jgi:hypothetical protein